VPPYKNCLRNITEQSRRKTVKWGRKEGWGEMKGRTLTQVCERGSKEASAVCEPGLGGVEEPKRENRCRNLPRSFTIQLIQGKGNTSGGPRDKWVHLKAGRGRDDGQKIPVWD